MDKLGRHWVSFVLGVIAVVLGLLGILGSETGAIRAGEFALAGCFIVSATMILCAKIIAHKLARL